MSESFRAKIKRGRLSVMPRNAAVSLARLVLFVCTGLHGAALAPAQDTDATIRLGFLHNEADKYDVEWRQYWGFGRHLVDDGFVSGLTEMRGMYRGGWTEDTLYESLKRFNVVVWPMAYEGSYHLTDELRERAGLVRRALERYVADGGGLFIIAQAVRYPGDDDEKYNNLIIEGFGARMMHEGIHDKTQEFTSPGGLVIRPESFFFTENVAEHPVTEAVRRVYLPVRRGRAPGVEAIEYSGDWAIVLAGSENARSYFVGHDNILDLEREVTYRSSPPLAAVRDLGKGRIFMYAVPYRQLFLNYGNPVWPGISEEVGDQAGGHPSDSLKMAMNALRWLAEPSLGDTEFGTYEPAPYQPIEYAQSVEWDSQQFAGPTDGVRGLVGAHTGYTDGKGTVAEYAAAAKAAGLSFLVFTEPLEMLSEGEFASLKEDCAAVSTDDFYTCPGVEFTDALGVRWAAWGEKVIYPPPIMPERGKDYPYFDGKVLHVTGKYAIDNAFGPNGIVGMDKLRESGAHPANLWWFFRFMPLIYEGERLIEDDFDDFLYSLRDLRWMSLSSFSRVRDPSRLAAAAEACCTVLPRAEHVRQWCNSRCGTYHPVYGKSYVTQGPRINQWWAINSQMENPWRITCGAQRVRVRFVVSSEVGIRDVTIPDANFGIIRRFEGKGATELTREFEMVHDKQHYLALVVTDVEGKRALGNYWLLYCYKSGLYRCGDNLNTLGSAAVLLHPDRHQRLMMHKVFEDVWKVTLRGFDTGAGIASQPSIFPLKLIETPEGAYPRDRGLMTAGVLDVPLASYNVSITSMDFSSLAPRYEYEDRCTPSMGGILPLVGPHEYAEWSETAYLLRSRMDYFTAWNHRRVFEGARDYRGGLVWHEGYLKIRKDVEVKPGISIPLFCVQGPGGAAHRTCDHLFVLDAERGPLAWQVTEDEDPPTDCHGEIQAGGYAAIMPTDVGYLAFFAGTGSPFRYSGTHWARQRGANGRLYVGFGNQDGGVMKAGTEIPYRCLIGTINDGTVSPDLMADLAEAYNLDGGSDGYPFAVKVGQFVDAEFFLTVECQEGEAAIDIGPRDMICDLAFRLRKVEDNGCAAVYVEGQDFFRFIAVSDGVAYFQEPIDPAAHLWAGNVFLCDRKDVKLTLVMYGQAEGAQPFLEVHNPGGEAVQARIWSPAHTPVFGGTEMTVELPPGDSVRVSLDI